MSRRTPTPRRRLHAPVFAALGDPTRLALVDRLSGGDVFSIAQLTEGMPFTRQAITKHLRVLQHAGVVRCRRHGREILFALEAEPLQDAHTDLQMLSERWDRSLARLKEFVESD